MNQRIIRKGIIIGLILAMGFILAGFGISRVLVKDQDNCCKRDNGKDEPRSHADFYILEAISHQVLMNR